MTHSSPTTPKAAIKPQDIKDADFVLITHDNYDRLRDAFEIVKATKAKLVGVFDIAVIVQKAGIK